MAKMLIDSKTLEDLANALRSVTGQQDGGVRSSK